MSKKVESKTNQFFSLKKILKRDAEYNVIFGERSNGKTYALLKHALERYLKTGEQSAYVRRWQEDLKGARASTLYNALVADGTVERLTKGEYNEVFHMGGRWFLSKLDVETGKRKPDLTPFCYGFCLSAQEHEKSTSYPNVTTVIFDEFLTRRYYLPDEFMLFMNLLSTIIRQRENVQIFMLGNTVNKYCPYFVEMGLKQIQQMEQGDIDIYRFGVKGATVAVEYTASTQTDKPSNKYFSFDNQKLEMITGGKWELDFYPHLPYKYKPKDVIFTYYIILQDRTLQANIINVDNRNFTYVHNKTTEIKDRDNTVIYSLKPDGNPLHRRRLIGGLSKMDRIISKYYMSDSVFFQDNDIGDVVRNYILISTKNNVLKV